MGRGQPTIADVADRAGVGVSTVSRVLNDGQVSAPARERVLAAISELAYRPRASARALASGSTGTVGLDDPLLHAPVRRRACARRAGRHGVDAVRARRLRRRRSRAARRVPRPARPARPLRRAADRLAGAARPRGGGIAGGGRRRRARRRGAPAAAERRRRRRARGRAGDASTCSSSATSGSRSSATPAIRASGSCRAPGGWTATGARSERRGFRCGRSSSAWARTGAASPTA